jgi:hypothetical protein
MKHLVFVVAFLLVSSASALAGATSYVFRPPASGPTTRQWSDPMQWLPNGVPGPGDSAVVDLGQLGNTYGLEADQVTVLSLTLNGSLGSPELVGSGVTIQAGGTFDWQGGGTSANITLLPGVTATFESGIHWLDGAMFTNGGTITWTGGLLLGNGDAVFTNSNTGSITMTAGTTGFAGQVNSCDFYNEGTLDVTGSGTVSSGASYGAAWGFHNSGTLSLGAGITLELVNALNTQHSLDGGQILGMGTLLFDEPDVTKNDSLLTLNGTTSLAAGVTLAFAPGVTVNAGASGAILEGPGTLLWTGGQLIDSAQGDVDNNQPSLTWASNLVVHLTGSALKDFAGAYVISAAPVTWDAGPLGLDGHSYFTNDGTFTAAGDFGINPATIGAASTFENHGTLVKSSGTGTLTVNNVTVLNYGTIDAASGTISLFTTSGTADVLEAGSTLKGSIVATCEVSLAGTSTVAAGATLELADDGMGDQAILDGSGTLGGPGTVKIHGASIVASSGGAITFASGGQVVLAANATTTRLTVDNPPSAMTFAGTTSWTGGNLEIWDGTVVNSGAWTTTAGATLTNNGGGSLFSNTGAFTASPGASATLELLAPFSNAGAMVFASGTTHFGNSGYVQTAGTTTLAGGGATTQDLNTLTDYNAFDIQGGTLGGAGTVDAPVTCEGTLAPGTSSAAGTLTVTKTYVQSSTGTLAVNLGGTQAGAEFDVLAVSGDVTLDGKLTVGLLGSYEPAVGDTYKILRSASANPVTGTFVTVNMPAGVTLTATYDPNDVTLGITSVSMPDAGSGSGGASSSSASSSGTAAGGASSSSASGSSASSSGASSSGGAPDAGATGGGSSTGGASQSGSCALGTLASDRGAGWLFVACALGAAVARRRRSR